MKEAATPWSVLIAKSVAESIRRGDRRAVLPRGLSFRFSWLGEGGHRVSIAGWAK